METYNVQVLNPKAVQLLQDLAALNLIALQPGNPVAKQPGLTTSEQDRVHEHTVPTLPDDEMLEWLRESPPPFRHE